MKRIALTLLFSTSCALFGATKVSDQPSTKSKRFGTVIEFSANKSGSARDQFNAAVGEADIVVVDFYGPGCGPCINLAPKFAQIAKENPDVKFIKVNVDTHKDIASLHSIRSMPTVLFFHQGTRKKGTHKNDYVVVGCNPGLIRDYLKKLR